VELDDAITSLKVFGVRLDVEKQDNLETESSLFVDADEIDSMLKGIDYIAKVDNSVTKMKSFQVDYRTKDDLEISAFSSSDGKIGTATTSGVSGRAITFLAPEGLAQLRALIVEAKTQIEAAH
jgi:hypothetical protein